MSARWLLPAADPALCDSLSSQLAISPVTAQVLINRGLRDPEAAHTFLNPQLNDLADPDLLPGMGPAVERIDKAARDKEKMLVYGDYDVDGTAATALLVRFLRLAGLDVEYYVPHRIEEGYGLNTAALAAFKSRGISLVITVDCGVSAVAEAEYARAEGLDLIITDHHEPGDQIASACAIVNPKMTGSLHPFRELSGVGVAFKFAWAVAKRFSDGQKMSEEFRNFLLNSLGLVALGTVADIVPLLGENRIFAKYGLKALGVSCGPGLRALIECCRLQGKSLSPIDIAYGLAPRLNAAGRMADAGLAIDLMMTEDRARALEIAATLDRHNKDRQKLQNETFLNAREMLLAQPDFESARAIILASDGWHPGIIGIVASKLVDEFTRPAALIALHGAVGKGSARSIPGFHLFNALEGFRHSMISFGGHAGAAGFQIEAAHIPGFSSHLKAAAAQASPDLFQRTLEADAEVSLADLTPRLTDELDRLGPHGEANPRPLFVVRNLRVAGRPKLMGMNGRHIAFYLTDGKSSYRSVAFGMGEELYDRMIAGDRQCSIVFSPRFNAWTGSGELELHVKDILWQ